MRLNLENLIVLGLATCVAGIWSALASAAPVDSLAVHRGLYSRVFISSGVWQNSPVEQIFPLTIVIMHNGVEEDFQVPALPPSVHSVPVTFAPHSISFGSYVTFKR